MTTAPTDLAEATRAVVAGGRDDPGALLGALFDAGLAWVEFPYGNGGRGLAAHRQAEVDAVLDAAGIRPDWERNPMGVGMIAPAIAIHGTDAQRDRWLRQIFTAEEQWCQLFSEPGAGSDLASLAMRAHPAGEHRWRLTGQKTWTSNAPQSRWALALARTDAGVPRHRGITAFVVDMTAPGIEIRPIREMTGHCRFSEVFLNDVLTETGAVLGEVGEGWAVARTVLGSERASIGATIEPSGSGEVARLLASWARTNRPTRLRDRVASTWVSAEVLRLTKIRLRATTAAPQAGAIGAMLKLSEALRTQAARELTLDLMGAWALLAGGTDSDDNPGHRFLLGQANTIAGGTSEILRDIVADRLLDLPRAR